MSSITTEEEKKENDSETPAQTEFVIDAEKLAKRQKQIDFGKNTLAYQRYSQQIPRCGLASLYLCSVSWPLEVSG